MIPFSFQPKRSQFGRSMLEMLGVLAIIGLLSVAALAGFTYAMNKPRPMRPSTMSCSGPPTFP